MGALSFNSSILQNFIFRGMWAILLKICGVRDKIE